MAPSKVSKRKSGVALSEKKKKQKKDPLEQLLSTNGDLTKIETNYGERIKCLVTKHEMMPDFATVEKHLISTRYVLINIIQRIVSHFNLIGIREKKKIGLRIRGLENFCRILCLI